LSFKKNMLLVTRAERLLDDANWDTGNQTKSPKSHREVVAVPSGNAKAGSYAQGSRRRDDVLSRNRVGHVNGAVSHGVQEHLKLPANVLGPAGVNERFAGEPAQSIAIRSNASGAHLARHLTDRELHPRDTCRVGLRDTWGVGHGERHAASLHVPLDKVKAALSAHIVQKSVFA
jgi:hypothetical protein